MTRLDPDPLRPAEPRVPVPLRPHVGCWPLVALGIALALAWLATAPVWLATAPRPAPEPSMGAAQIGAPPDSILVPTAATGDVRPVGAPTSAYVSPMRTAHRSRIDSALVAHRGVWAFANPSHGSRYLATPERVGTRVRVCGPLGCRTLITNDVGPVLSLQRAGRLGDLSAVLFVALCGDLSRGLCAGSYAVLPALPPLPATDEEAK